MTTVKRILCDEIEDLSDTFFLSTHEFVKLYRDLESNLLRKASVVRKANLNIC
ncbi:hypothetical protein [Bartonella koehlerae]|uniref:hypothetical protein n=1 Tax=Bartonella koehlerae TaxID=92181 RepID=UPI000A7BC6BE|nr:hypothetical protein [Bartonella koehlerae]